MPLRLRVLLGICGALALASCGTSDAQRSASSEGVPTGCTPPPVGPSVSQANGPAHSTASAFTCAELVAPVDAMGEAGEDESGEDDRPVLLVPPPRIGVVYQACPSGSAPEGLGWLRSGSVPAVALSETLKAEGLDAEVVQSEGGTLTVRDGGTLQIASGVLLVGTASEAAEGSAYQRVELGAGPVTARVLVSVLRGPSGHQAPAFAELVLPGGPAVSWSIVGSTIDDATGENLGSGVVAGGVPVLEAAYTDTGPGGYVPEALAYFDVLYRDSDAPPAKGVPGCAVRRDPSGEVVGLMLEHAQYGDAGVYAGRDADGRVVSLVLHAGTAPWTASGLPGSRPSASDR